MRSFALVGKIGMDYDLRSAGGTTTLTFTGSFGSHAGADLTFCITDYPGGTEYVTKTIGDGITVLSATTISVRVSRYDTRTMTPGPYCWVLRDRHSDEEVIGRGPIEMILPPCMNASALLSESGSESLSLSGSDSLSLSDSGSESISKSKSGSGHDDSESDSASKSKSASNPNPYYCGCGTIYDDCCDGADPQPDAEVYIKGSCDAECADAAGTYTFDTCLTAGNPGYCKWQWTKGIFSLQLICFCDANGDCTNWTVRILGVDENDCVIRWFEYADCGDVTCVDGVLTALLDGGLGDSSFPEDDCPDCSDCIATIVVGAGL